MSTPQGFRDVLTDEAQRREKIQHNVQTAFAQCGYKPIETPTLEQFDVMQQGCLKNSGSVNFAGASKSDANFAQPAGANAGLATGSNAPFKFFDATGSLVAMRPDVTVQVARMCATRLRGVREPMRFRYSHRVFRETDGSLQAQAREVTQIGAECIGESGVDADAEVVGLLARVLEIAGVRDYTLALATVSPVRALLCASGAPVWWQRLVLQALHSSDLVQLDRLTCDEGMREVVREVGLAPDVLAQFKMPLEYARAIRELSRVRGGAEVINRAREITLPLGCDAGLDDLEQLIEKLQVQNIAGDLLIDFSMINSFDYYTGVVFSAFSPYVGMPLGGGGRYDGLIGAFGANRPAAGCAFYLESAMEAVAKEEAQQVMRDNSSQANKCSGGDDGGDGIGGDDASDANGGNGNNDSGNDDGGVSRVNKAPTRPLRIAVPKGSLNADTIRALTAAGLDTTGLDNPGRQLIIKNPGVDFIIVRPTDAPAFVAHGAADCGICGRDSLLEADVDVIQLVDLKFGACRFVVAEPAGAADVTYEHYKRAGSIRVATKYPRITRAHFSKTGMQTEIVKLHGNIELAPLTGMAERIVDITATGTTLRENNLVVVEDVISSTARFFANVSAYRTDVRCANLATALSEATLS